MPMKHTETEREREETRKESWSEEVWERAGGRKNAMMSHGCTQIQKQARERNTLSHTHTRVHTHMLLPVSLTELHCTLLQLRMWVLVHFSLFLSRLHQLSLCPHVYSFFILSFSHLSLSRVLRNGSDQFWQSYRAPDLSNGCFLSCFVSFSCSFANFQSLLCREPLCKRLSLWLCL